jgi:GT2 family glycosyltransferase
MSFFIAILSYNHPLHTARAIESALRLSSRVGLLHNGSEDSHRNHLKERFPQIKHWELKKNRGYSGGANFALRQAFEHSDWVIFLTNDCEILNLPELPRELSMVAPRILKRQTTQVDSLGGSFNIQKAHLSHCRSIQEFESAAHAYIPGSAFLIHKNIFEMAKEFDEQLGTYWEDVDFSLRAKEKGALLSVQSLWQVRHKIGKTCHQDSYYTTYLFQRNRITVSLAHAKAHQVPVLFLHLVRSWLTLSWRLARKGRWSDCRLLFKAILDS